MKKKQRNPGSFGYQHTLLDLTVKFLYKNKKTCQGYDKIYMCRVQQTQKISTLLDPLL